MYVYIHTYIFICIHLNMYVYIHHSCNLVSKTLQQTRPQSPKNLESQVLKKNPDRKNNLETKKTRCRVYINLHDLSIVKFARVLSPSPPKYKYGRTFMSSCVSSLTCTKSSGFDLGWKAIHKS